jgi:predicted small integral membrane protein
MFYLKEFFKSLGEAPIRGMSFMLFSCLLAMSLTHRAWIAQTIQKVSPEKMVNPYFVAVIDGSVDAAKMKLTLSKLPGVLEIDDKDSDRSRSKLNELVGQLGTDYNLSSELLNFKSIKIMMSPALSVESLDFVRNQVVKMGGRDHITATDIKYPEVTSAMKSHPFYSFLTKAGDWGVIGILALLWVISYVLCYSVFRSRSYIIEKFQRKKLVAAKSIASGLGIVLVLFTALGIWNGTLKFFDLIILSMVFSVFWTFSMQDWRWKPTL